MSFTVQERGTPPTFAWPVEMAEGARPADPSVQRDAPLVLVVGDSSVEIECLARALCDRNPDIEVVSRPLGALHRLNRQPDAVLLCAGGTTLDEATLPALVGSLQAAYPDIPVVVLANDAEAATAGAGLVELGVSGCVSHDIGLDGLARILWLVLRGGVCFPRNCIRPAQTAARDAPADQTPDPAVAPDRPCPGLTQRECEVVRLLRLGKPNKIIAYELGISISTVKVHIRNILRKTGSNNRVEAALQQSEGTRNTQTGRQGNRPARREHFHRQNIYS